MYVERRHNWERLVSDSNRDISTVNITVWDCASWRSFAFEFNLQTIYASGCVVYAIVWATHALACILDGGNTKPTFYIQSGCYRLPLLWGKPHSESAETKIPNKRFFFVELINETCISIQGELCGWTTVFFVIVLPCWAHRGSDDENCIQFHVHCLLRICSSREEMNPTTARLRSRTTFCCFDGFSAFAIFVSIANWFRQFSAVKGSWVVCIFIVRGQRAL